MRIASLIVQLQVNAIYRSFIPMRELAKHGHHVAIEQVPHDRIPDPQRFLEFDGVHFWRACSPPFQALAGALRQAGVATIFDDDDDYTAIPREHPAYRTNGGFKGRQQLAEIRRMMRLTSMVTTPSETLASRYGQLSGGPVRVLENYLPASFPRQPLRREGRIDVCWLAAVEHRSDYDRLRLKPVFQRLLEAHENVHLHSIGLKLGIDHPRYERIDMTPHEDLPDVLARMDVGIAPLADIPFNRGRSSIKLKEYAACGAAWLASPVGPYRDLGEREGGRLVADDAWEQALTELIVDGEQRAQLARQAVAWGRSQTIGSHWDEWEAVVVEARQRLRGAGGSAGAGGTSAGTVRLRR